MANESLEHKLAKTLLVNFLKDGKTLFVDCRCHRGEAHTMMFAGFKKVVAEGNVESKGLFHFDVACYAKESDEEPCAGLEVFYSHRTTGKSAEKRDIVPWAEIHANEVITRVGKLGHRYNEISLTDIRLRESCEICSAAK